MAVMHLNKFEMQTQNKEEIIPSSCGTGRLFAPGRTMALAQDG